jgi:hypothetical protein
VISARVPVARLRPRWRRTVSGRRPRAEWLALQPGAHRSHRHPRGGRRHRRGGGRNRPRCSLDGRVHTELRLPRRRRGQRNSTSPDIVAAVRQLVRIAHDDLIAGILNRNKLTTGHGNRWTRERVPAAALRGSRAGAAMLASRACHCCARLAAALRFPARESPLGWEAVLSVRRPRFTPCGGVMGPTEERWIPLIETSFG